MKKNILGISIFCLLIIISILYYDERTERKEIQEESEKWKVIAQSEQEIPLINEEAKKFVKSLHRGNHLDYLTGAALQEYKEVLENDLSLDEPDEKNNMNVSLQDISVLLSNTIHESKKEFTSTLLYQINYEGIFNSEQTGVVDQRIMTLLMKIKWIAKDKKYLVDSYSVELMDDTLGLDLSSNLEGSNE